MLRVVLLNLLMFALPFMAYALYLRSPASAGQSWRQAPFLVLLGTGLLLVIVTMAIVISFGGFGTRAQYQPAIFEDGVIKPGEFE